jgi:hypothetical protein
VFLNASKWLRTGTLTAVLQERTVAAVLQEEPKVVVFAKAIIKARLDG